MYQDGSGLDWSCSIFVNNITQSNIVTIGKYIGIFCHTLYFKIGSYYYTFVNLDFFLSNFVFLSKTQFPECMRKIEPFYIPKTPVSRTQIYIPETRVSIFQKLELSNRGAPPCPPGQIAKPGHANPFFL